MAGFTYKSYNFGAEKDPIIDEVRTIFEQSGWTYQRVEDESGVTYQTLRNWFEGKTRKPQAATVNAVLRSMGFKLGIVPHTVVSNIVQVDVEKQIAPSPKNAMRHVLQMNKFRGK